MMIEQKLRECHAMAIDERWVECNLKWELKSKLYIIIQSGMLLMDNVHWTLLDGWKMFCAGQRIAECDANIAREHIFISIFNVQCQMRYERVHSHAGHYRTCVKTRCCYSIIINVHLYSGLTQLHGSSHSIKTKITKTDENHSKFNHVRDSKNKYDAII